MAKIKTRGGRGHKTKPKGVAKHAFERVYWPYLPLILIISLLLTLGGRTGSLNSYIHHPSGQVLSYATSMSISGLLSDTNAARSANGVADLRLNTKLEAAAQAKAADMAARDYWSHYTPDGDPPWVFVTAENYAYQKLGENLAAGFDDEQSTINGWMASPPHRENLLDPSFKDVGFGFSNIADYTSAGGGPMTVVVAFYGDPAAVTAPVATNTSSAVPSSPQPVASESKRATSSTPKTKSTAKKPTAHPAQSKQATTTATPKSQQATQVKQSRIQVALSDSKLASASTGAALLAALLLAAFWASRHLRALHKFLLKGEHYAVRHPITDIGLLVIACLLFILSQTAGIIQ
ncbi:MAG TPA: CAP domain-containing protein [Candidatus Saccharimonadales bacterium]|nr:CAP domain-containing protein [Candidatus Saccharimonadales bacterium]